MGLPRALMGLLAIGAISGAALWLAPPRPLASAQPSDLERDVSPAKQEDSAAKPRVERSAPDARRSSTPAPEPSADPAAIAEREASVAGGAVEPGAPESFREDDRLESLDEASDGWVRERLERAVAEASRERGLRIAAGVVERVVQNRRVRVIFDSSVGAEEIAALLAEAPGAATARVDDFRVYNLLPYGAAEVGPQALLNLIEAPGVQAIELDAVYRQTLDDSLGVIGADVAHASGQLGQGTAIAVIDSGVDTAHPMFAGRILSEACFVLTLGCPNGLDEMIGPGAGVPCVGNCGHGSHVAGIAVGDDPVEGISGVAPAAGLIAIQVFQDVAGERIAYGSDVLAALDHVAILTAVHPIVAVNLSLGGDPYVDAASCDTANGATKAAIDLLATLGIATVVASGNEGFTNAIAAPACISSAISVGSTTKTDDVSIFSNSADFLDLLAPGSAIRSADVGGIYNLRSGTSMAAPHVAGAFAVIRSAVPTADVATTTNALRMSGVAINDPGNGLSFPRIDVPAAVALASVGGGAPPPTPPTPPAPPGGGAVPTTPLSPASGDSSSSSCGLVGWELLGAVFAARALRDRRRAAVARSRATARA